MENRERITENKRIISEIADVMDELQSYLGNYAYEPDRLIKIGREINDYLLFIEGETENISEAFKRSHPDIPWEKLEHVLYITYSNKKGIEHHPMWDTIYNDFPKIREKLREIASSMEENEGLKAIEEEDTGW
jgi:uncharacterized protein with HEPN domain